MTKYGNYGAFCHYATCCKNIRDDHGYWESIETYVSNHSEAIFTESICPDCAAKAEGKYAKVSLPDETRKEYARRLEKFMLQEQAFLNEEISIPQISEELSIPKHLLSMTINIEFGENFSAYVNRYRIRYAELLLKNPDKLEESILMIAYLSGFQSKASFHRAFKSLNGLTPKEYRKKYCNDTRGST